MTDVRLAMTTVANRVEAEQIARALVEERLCACVNIVPGVSSIYRWQQVVEQTDELLLLMKTSAAMLEGLEARLRALHSYDTPEFLVLPVESGGAAYLAWVSAQLGSTLLL